MDKVKKWTTDMLARAGTAFTAFPAAVTFALFAAVTQILLVGKNSGNFILSALLLTFITGAVSNLLLMLLVKRLELGNTWSLALTGAGILLPCAVFLLMFTASGQTGLLKMRILVVNLIMVLVILLLLTFRNARMDMSNIVSRLFKRVLEGSVFGLAFLLVSYVIAAAVNILFLPEMSEDVFIKLAVFAGFIILVFIIGSFVDIFEPDSPENGPLYRATMEKVISYIFIPAVFLLLAVEFLLIGKAVIYSNWSAAVDIFMRQAVVLGIGCLVYMLASQYQNAICRVYRVALPCAGLLALAIGVWRLYALIGSFGITDKRYFAAAGYLFLAICLIVILIGGKGKGTVVIVSAILISLVTVLPVLNYHTVSAFSQMRRAETIMQRNGMLADAVITAPETISESDRLELSRAVQYLVEAGETDMADWLPVTFEFYADYQAVFGIRGEYDEQGQSTLIGKTYVGELADKYYSVKKHTIVLSNYTTYNLYNFAADNIAGETGVYSVKFTVAAGDSLIMVVTKDRLTVLEEDVTPQLLHIAAYLEETARQSKTGVVAMPQALMTLEAESDEVLVEVILKSITVAADNPHQRPATALTDIILIGEK